MIKCRKSKGLTNCENVTNTIDFINANSRKLRTNIGIWTTAN